MITYWNKEAVKAHTARTWKQMETRTEAPHPLVHPTPTQRTVTVTQNTRPTKVPIDLLTLKAKTEAVSQQGVGGGEKNPRK